MNKKIIFILLLLFTFLPISVFAQEVGFLPTKQIQEETLEVSVLSLLEEKEIDLMGTTQLFQKLECVVTKGSQKGKIIIIKNGNIPLTNLQKYQKGDNLLVSFSQDIEGNDLYFITDYVRKKPLFLLFFIFIAVTLLIAKWRGLSSLLGMGMSFFIIFKFILPRIIAGFDPIQTAIIGSFFIIPITFYLSHGFNKKTTIAIAGTIIALIITGVLANVFVSAVKLTGYSSEEASFLQLAQQGAINMRGLLLAGIIIGVLGILDDITISQSAIVYELKKTNSRLKQGELFKQAMNVGQDHISSMVNTLVLVYTGASLPLLLLFIGNPHPFLEIINYEIIADEIVRTLVGSIGLVLAVPITTLIASVKAKEK